MADEDDLRRVQNGEVDLTYCDLRGSDLSGMKLSGRDFAHSRLDGVQAVGTDFREANFTRAMLFNAILTNADCRNATFSAMAGRVTFDGADLRGARFGSAISGTSFRRADLRGADFRGARIRERNDFEGAIIDELTNFEGVSLLRSQARDPIFEYFEFRDGRLTRRSEAPTENVKDDSQLSGHEMAPVSEGDDKDIRAQVFRVAQEVREHLKGLETSIPAEDGLPGIGHNGPPGESPMTSAESQAVLGVISDLEAQVGIDQPDVGLIEEIRQKLQGVTQKIVGWAGPRWALIEEEFFKGIGAAASDPKVLFAGWLIFSGKLDQLIALLSDWLPHLIK